MTLSGLKRTPGYDFGLPPSTSLGAEYGWLHPDGYSAKTYYSVGNYNNWLFAESWGNHHARNFSYAALRTASAGGPNDKCRLGIYANEGGLPGALIDAGIECVFDGAAGLWEFAWSFTLPPGQYFLAQVWTSFTSPFNVEYYSTEYFTQYPPMGSVKYAGAIYHTGALGCSRSYGYAALPDPWGTHLDSLPSQTTATRSRPAFWMFR